MVVVAAAAKVAAKAAAKAAAVKAVKAAAEAAAAKAAKVAKAAATAAAAAAAGRWIDGHTDEELNGGTGRRTQTYIYMHAICWMLVAAVDSVMFSKKGGSTVTWSCDKDCKGWEEGKLCMINLIGEQLTGAVPAEIGMLTCKDMVTKMYRTSLSIVL